MNGVQLNKVVKRYDNGIEVIHGIDLDIKKGEFVVFVGPSGCGKSTLMRMVAGLEGITGGQIAIDGRVVNELPPRERDIAMVFQDYALYPHKTVFDNMAFGLKLRKFSQDEIQKRVMAAAKSLKIDHLLDRKPRALSGGQRQRVAMGRAIVRQAKVFLFDEPLSNLDALLRSEMRTEIKRLHQEIRATTIYVTHDQVEAMTLAERIVVLSAGKIMQVGTPDEIYNEPRSRFVAGFTGSPPMNFLKGRVQIASDGAAYFNLGGGVQIGLSRPGRHIADELNGRTVEFGIRPEDIAAAPRASDEAEVAAKVVVVEPLGAETLVVMQCGGQELTARMPPNLKFAPEDVVNLRLDMSKFHLFDAESGNVIATK